MKKSKQIKSLEKLAVAAFEYLAECTELDFESKCKEVNKAEKKLSKKEKRKAAYKAIDSDVKRIAKMCNVSKKGLVSLITELELVNSGQKTFDTATASYAIEKLIASTSKDNSILDGDPEALEKVHKEFDAILKKEKKPPPPKAHRIGDKLVKPEFPSDREEVITPYPQEYILANKLNPKYRIEQTAKNQFNIEKLFIEEVKGRWFWSEKIIIKKWCRIDALGDKGRLSNLFKLLEFGTLKEAQQAIKDLGKYPVIHELEKT